MNLSELAHRLMDHAERVMPPTRRHWTRAMRAELDHIPDPFAAAAFAFDCLVASCAKRIEDVMTLARLTRWTLAILALAWAAFSGLAAALLMAVKTRPGVQPADLGADAGTAETLRFIQAYPAWELSVVALIAGLLALGAVDLARRQPRALAILGLGVGAAIWLALFDLRLPDPEGNRPLGSLGGLMIPLLCLAPAWWLCRSAPDLKTTA